MTVYALMWSYSDNSGYGVVGVYGKKEDAERDLALLNRFCDSRQFEVNEVDYFPPSTGEPDETP